MKHGVRALKFWGRLQIGLVQTWPGALGAQWCPPTGRPALEGRVTTFCSSLGHLYSLPAATNSSPGVRKNMWPILHNFDMLLLQH